MSLRTRLGQLDNLIRPEAPAPLCPVTPLDAARIMLAAYRRLGPDSFPDEVNELADIFVRQGTEESGQRFRQAVGNYLESERGRPA